MLLWLSQWLSEFNTDFSVFSYITLRSILSALTALAISLMVGPGFIRRMSRSQGGQPIRSDGPETHFVKAGTPTMGGALILLAVVLSTLLWGDLSNSFIWLVVLVTLAFGVVGWIDDYKKIVKQDPNGMASRWKYLSQSIIGLAAAGSIAPAGTPLVATELEIPVYNSAGAELSNQKLLVSDIVTIVGAANSYAEQVTPVANTLDYVINHALDSEDVVVQIYLNNAAKETIFVDVERTDVDNVTVKFGFQPDVNTDFTVLVQK